ncbi:MAG: polysaccharide pyruvyl transferase family protein [Paludibacteraceae bacterium]|nr:polysaccharide pyruvyl transferase family protein [Paludibacteraceae bacterium]
MTANDKIVQLRQTIVSQLSPLIDRDYYLLELPYYNNIGDALIWQGEEDFLATLPHKCLGRYALETFNFPAIPDGTLILFQGGGNFGDLWTKHHEFKMQVVERYPNCKFLFLPQTVFFQDKTNLQACAERLSANKNVTICARDKSSYETLKSSFANTILLVPDMAFCIDSSRLPKCETPREQDLLIVRNDAELQPTDELATLMQKSNIAVHDWPPLERRDFYTWLLVKFSPIVGRGLLDWYCQTIYKPFLVRCGVRFLNRYRTVHSTRLHGAILALLLGKDVVLYDNSYGKNSGFYNTWLADCENITLRR